MKKRSISFQVTFVMACILFGTVLLCWILNTFMLEDYYISKKERSLRQAFLTVSQESNKGSLQRPDFDVTFETLCFTNNLTMLIMRPNGMIIKSSANNNEELRQQLFNAVFIQSADEKSILKRTDDYVLIRQKDERLSSDYLALWGTLSDGSFILIRSALEGIRDAANISNQFLLITGSLVMVFSILIMYHITNRLTEPIRSLTAISGRMRELDFDARYTGRSSKEVDELGEHMNEMSETLLTTIEDLKTANNELLLDNQRRAEVDEMRKEFLSNVSHELKTPLALISGYAEGLKEGIAEDPESRDYYLDVIMDETKKMTYMVKEILTLNNIEFGSSKPEMKRFDLTELIRGVVAKEALMYEREDIQVDFNGDQPCHVYGDEFRVEEVVTNYLTNAIHHCEGEKRIMISLQEEGSLVHASFFNTGKPIPEEELDKIWIKFYKIDKARSREYGGSGIGLSVVKAIMDSMNQQCGVTNHADGVEFTFTLERA